ncbi:uncharacterized protein LOC111057717 [Nilaparvata lugens]|uniref:uncharacterized protein LOC111057717 n=1 Tax=Nilaparvata lugens TaxID=108931 RepID=UPI00193D13FB|nr:uncharacterized protein LOC111057717 [Nilaparvata lugens]
MYPSSLQLLAVLCLTAVFFIQPGSCIKCFQCNSHNDSRCAQEKPPEDLMKDCSELDDATKKYSMCRKITQTIEFEVNGLQPDSRVIRSCGWDESNYKGRCYQRSGFGGRQEVCSCLTDLCNAAQRTATVSVTGLLLASAALLRFAL